MNKELLNKIMPYCGHRLKVLEDEQIRTVVGIYYDQFDYEQGYSSQENGDISLSKPILFSPECIYREIETEYGKEIPLIELAKISTPFPLEWTISDKKAVGRSSEVSIVFLFDGKSSFGCYVGGFLLTSMKQWELFQYLYSRHIAFNLEPDEYVSVKSLEKNPYATKQ